MKPINTLLTDSGRKASGIKEKADCTVRAVAEVFGLQYTEAHEKMKELGRKNRCAVKFFKLVDALGLERRPDLSCMTVAKALPEMKSGKFIVRIARHVFSVIDGVAYDKWPVNGNSRVLMAYELKD